MRKGILLKFSNYSLARVLVTVIWTGFIGLFGCAESQPQVQSTTVANRVAVGEVKAAAPSFKRTYTGQVRAQSQGEYSFEVGGKVRRLYLEVGDAFRQGDVLAELDPEINALSLAEIEASVNQAKFDFENASLELKRRQKLFQDKLVSSAEVDVWKLRTDTAKAQIDVLEARRDLAKKRLADTRIIAPFDGTVTQRFVNANENVVTGQPVYALSNINSALEVVAYIPYQHVKQDFSGRTIAMKTLNGKPLTGQVTSLNQNADASALVDVIIELEPQFEELVYPGVPVEVTYDITHDKQTLMLPAEALQRATNGDHYVWRVHTSDQTAIKIPVSITAFTNDEVEISVSPDAQLSAGDAVVTSGATSLNPTQNRYPITL